MTDLTIEERDLQVVLGILCKLVPDIRILAFGSRVNGRCGKFSDLDLAFDAKEKISIDRLCELQAAFRESDLPFKVDLMDLMSAPETLRVDILNQAVTLQSGAGRENSALTLS